MWFDLIETLDEVRVDVDDLLLASGRNIRLTPRCYLLANARERRQHYETVFPQKKPNRQCFDACLLWKTA